MAKKLLIILVILLSTIGISYGQTQERSLSRVPTFNVTESLNIGSAPFDATIIKTSSGTLYIPKLQAGELYYQGLDIAGHIGKAIDPHGASETITQGLTLGIGNPTFTITQTSVGATISGEANFTDKVTTPEAQTSSLSLIPSSLPTASTSLEGHIQYDSGTKNFYGCNGTSWVQLNNP